MLKPLYFAVLTWVAIVTMQAAFADESDTDQESLPDAEEIFVVGNATYAVLHEFGHAIIRDFDLPILGLEENSADTIASVSLVLFDRRYPESNLAGVIALTALVQAYMWQTGFEREHQEVMLWAQHGLSAQRFARLTCLLYGSDPERFAWVAEASEMDDIRAGGCEEEWRMAERAVVWIRENYGIPLDERADREAGTVSTKHGPAVDENSGKWRAILERRQTLENIATAMNETLEFPEPLLLRTKRCAAPNAYWDPEYREVILCYEFMGQVATLAERPEVTRTVERFRSGVETGGP